MAEVDPTPDPAPTGGEAVSLTRAEHDRLQAAARQLAKAERDRVAREAAEEARKTREDETAQGLRDQLAQRDRRDTLRDEIDARQLTPSQRRLVMRLADVTDANFNAADAVDLIQADYADIFTAPAEAPASEPSVPQTPPIRRAGPTPPAPRKNVPFEGFIAPDEYASYPQAVRLSPEFRKRVDASRPYWPTHFNPKAFPQSN